MSLASSLVASPKEGSNCDFPWERGFLGVLGSSVLLETAGSSGTSSWVLIREDKQSPCGCLNYRGKRGGALAALPWGLRGGKCSSGRLWGVFPVESKAKQAHGCCLCSPRHRLAPPACTASALRIHPRCVGTDTSHSSLFPPVGFSHLGSPLLSPQDHCRPLDAPSPLCHLPRSPLSSLFMDLI